MSPAGLLDWFFRDRATGRIVVGQFPNLTISAFAACAAAEWLFAPEGWFGETIRILKVASLLAWALDELLRGVNPWRRCLGAGVLAYLAWSGWTGRL